MRYVVTGANRGIGLEFVRQLVARGDRVDATARSVEAAKELSALAEGSKSLVKVYACDVTDGASVAAFAKALEPGGIDVLINNAGVSGQWSGIADLDFNDVQKVYDANAVGPLRVTAALLPRMRESKARKLVHISSGMGSIADNTSGGAYAYRMSKAALNMASRCLSIDLRDEKFVSVVMNPGWVATDMGGKNAPLAVDDSVRQMLGIIDGLKESHNGKFLDYKRGEFVW